MAGYPPQIPPQMQAGQQPVAGGPPGYTGGAGGYGAPSGQNLPTANYTRPAAEVEGSSRSKAQLIVGIDFVSPNLTPKTHAAELDDNHHAS